MKNITVVSFSMILEHSFFFLAVIITKIICGRLLVQSVLCKYIFLRLVWDLRIPDCALNS